MSNPNGTEEGNTDKKKDVGGSSNNNTKNVVINGNISDNHGRGNIDQDINIMGKLNTNQIVCQEMGKNGKSKTKKTSELELLGINKEANSEDKNQIIAKYKLRKSEKPISYKEPGDLKSEFVKNKLKPSKIVTTTKDDQKSKYYICTSCNREFSTVRALNHHVRCHDTVLEYTCSLCSQKFDKNTDLVAHKASHTSASFICEKCKLAFSEHCDFLIHNLIHATQSSVQCPECGIRYKKHSFKCHIMTHFDKKVSCPICPFTTNGEFNLRSHIMQHEYKKTCVECGKGFKSKHDYDYHMSTHTGVKRYQCLYCGKCFSNQAQRDVHTRTHTGERPYACDICEYKAKQSSTLKKHKITHEVERKHSCPICHKKFFHEQWAKIHMRCHTKKNLYECPECGKKLISMVGLKGHMMYKHTKEKPVECKMCNKTFINNNQYRRHIKAKYHLRNMYGSMMNKKGQK